LPEDATVLNTTKERRAALRHKSFIQGRIYFNHRRSSMDCIIREFTDIGARLEFSDVAALPDIFEVYVPSKDRYFQARAVWHRGNTIGVSWMPEVSSDPAPESFHTVDPIADRVMRLEHEVATLRKRLDALVQG
jgi:hypothetical protein